MMYTKEELSKVIDLKNFVNTLIKVTIEELHAKINTNQSIVVNMLTTHDRVSIDDIDRDQLQINAFHQARSTVIKYYDQLAVLNNMLVIYDDIIKNNSVEDKQDEVVVEEVKDEP